MQKRRCPLMMRKTCFFYIFLPQEPVGLHGHDGWQTSSKVKRKGAYVLRPWTRAQFGIVCRVSGRGAMSCPLHMEDGGAQSFLERSRRARSQSTEQPHGVRGRTSRGLTRPCPQGSRRGRGRCQRLRASCRSPRRSCRPQHRRAAPAGAWTRAHPVWQSPSARASQRMHWTPSLA